jgi:putative phosphonate catabolism associated alcohol dehydrogenase
MRTCKIVSFESSDKPLQFIDTPIPALKEQEILVRNEYATLCRSDIYTFTGMRKEKSPTILGHEIIGRIDSFGANAPLFDLRGNSLKIGDRITWAIFASDPTSEFSKRGMPQKAADLFKYGHEQITDDSNLHGGLSEYTILRKNTPIIKVDELVPLTVSAIINCAVATVAGAIRVAGDLVGKKTMICGTGMLGIIACAMAKTKGASSVIAVDTNEERLKIAFEFGADENLAIKLGQNNLQQLYFEKKGTNISIDTLIDLSGSPDAMENCIDTLGIGGTAVFIGATFPQRKIQIDAEKMVRKILTIKGLHNYNEQDLLAAVEFIETNHLIFPFEKLIYDGFDLSTANEAFQHAIDKNNFRVGIQTTINS